MVDYIDTKMTSKTITPFFQECRCPLNLRQIATKYVAVSESITFNKSIQKKHFLSNLGRLAVLFELRVRFLQK